jgi:hypothetical protein
LAFCSASSNLFFKSTASFCAVRAMTSLTS